MRRRPLRIRIYPDQVHLDAHEAELTDTEVAAGELLAGAMADGRQEEIAGTLDPRRARWVIEQLTPTNIGDEAVPDSAPTFPTPSRKGEAWSRAVHATALPDRWLVVGYRVAPSCSGNGAKPCPTCSPTPDPALDPDDEVPVDETGRPATTRCAGCSITKRRSRWAWESR